ncbi:5-azacytidine-induced protein 2 isoform X1 [Festucalex cinctus]
MFKDRFGEAASKQSTVPRERERGRREREIAQLVQRRRQLRKSWRKATQPEKEGLKVLWEEVRQRLSRLRRAERIRKRSQRKQKERASFFKDPFKHARQLLEEKKSGKLETTREQMEQHVKRQYSDLLRNVPLGTPGYVPQPAPPTTEFNIMPPKLSEVRQAVKKARSSSAPGPNGMPYKLYKNCPKVLELLWYLMRTAWKKQLIPSEWQRAVAIFIPKEENSKEISQFRNIALLNVEGKIFFSVLARRMTSYLLDNCYIDTNCQKAGVPGFPGCVEHSTMIWDQIQKAKREKTDLHVVWLDLANAYGSVPHQLINYALEFFHMPPCIKKLIARYFSDLQMCFALQDFTTGWQQLEVGIAMGCAISPVLFVAAFEIILIGARQMVGGTKLPSGQRLPPLRCYMDDVTSLLQTAACTSRLLKRVDELTSWARMRIKPSKSRSLSLRRGVRNDNTIFVVGGEKIPLLSEQPIKSLGRQYTAELSDKQMGRTIMKQLTDGLSRIDQSQLPGKYKVWCYQFVLYRRVMWPLKMSEIPSSAVSKMDGKANSFIRKWLGLPRCLSETGLFGKNALQLPLQSISLGYMQEKSRLVLELRESTDQSVRNANAKVPTGRKWNAQSEVDQAVSRLHHQEILGRVQAGRAGLGWGEAPRFWSKANRKEQKQMVVAEVARMEEERYKIKAVSQGRQGSWTTWEGVVNRNISWSDLWKIPQARISFLIRATYDTLPCPRNLHHWFGNEEYCSLCSAPNASLQHILSGCKTALSQGRYRWRHDQVLRKLAEVLEGCRQGCKESPSAENLTSFVTEGGQRYTRPRNITRPFSPGHEWDMRVDLNSQLRFPTEITTTSLRPDIVVWSTEAKVVHLIELTVPAEGGIEAAFEHKKAKYSELAAECREVGWKTTIYPVEVGCRGYVGLSATRLLRDAGVTGGKLRKAIKDLAEEAEKGSFWLWLRRKDRSWGKS